MKTGLGEEMMRKAEDRNGYYGYSHSMVFNVGSREFAWRLAQDLRDLAELCPL